MLRAVGELPEVTVVNQDNARYFLEVVEGETRLSSQATDLGGGSTLLFVWADAGDSGQTGRDLALDAVRVICEELDIEYKLVGK
jgi:hypothetical protein